MMAHPGTMPPNRDPGCQFFFLTKNVRKAKTHLERSQDNCGTSASTLLWGVCAEMDRSGRGDLGSLGRALSLFTPVRWVQDGAAWLFSESQTKQVVSTRAKGDSLGQALDCWFTKSKLATHRPITWLSSKRMQPHIASIPNPPIPHIPHRQHHFLALTQLPNCGIRTTSVLASGHCTKYIHAETSINPSPPGCSTSASPSHKTKLTVQ